MDFLREKTFRNRFFSIFVYSLIFFGGVFLFSAPGCETKKKSTTNTKNAKKYFEAAKEYEKHGKYDQAVEHYTNAIKENPEYAKAFRNRGMIHDSQGRSEKAIKDFVKACELDKTDMYPAQQLERLYREKGDTQNAKKYEKEMEKRQQGTMSNTRNNKDQIDKQQKQKQDAKKKK